MLLIGLIQTSIIMYNMQLHWGTARQRALTLLLLLVLHYTFIHRLRDSKILSVSS